MAKNFNGSIFDEMGLPSGKYKVAVKFTFKKTLEISDISLKTSIENGDLEKLKNEFTRVVKLIEMKKPATQNGKPVDVKYTFPMKFEVY